MAQDKSLSGGVSFSAPLRAFVKGVRRAPTITTSSLWLKLELPAPAAALPLAVDNA